MRISQAVLSAIGGLAFLLAGCSTAFETPTTLSSDAQLVPGERRLVPVMEYADGGTLAQQVLAQRTHRGPKWIERSRQWIFQLVVWFRSRR